MNVPFLMARWRSVSVFDMARAVGKAATIVSVAAAVNTPSGGRATGRGNAEYHPGMEPAARPASPDATRSRPSRIPPALDPAAAPGAWRAVGCWTVLALGDLAERLEAAPAPTPLAADGTLVVDGTGVAALDTTGALLLARWARRAGAATLRWEGWTEAQHALLAHMSAAGQEAPAAPPPAAEGPLTRLGRATTSLAAEAVGQLDFLGRSVATLAGELRHPGRLRWRSVLHHIGVTGVSALPIVGLLGVLMGIVVAYQGAGQLARYGANIFVVDLVGLSMLREFAPLVTAIIVAGRSGSAFAAQLGTMAVSEEIDALRALGLSPLSVLVLPRLLALVVVLPLLTAFADAMGLIGGMIMAAARLDVTFTSFLDRLPRAVSATTLMLGVGKAPVFACIVAVVGCYQGLKTAGGADAVGSQTTRSVVQSIFLVIVADAVFSVAFSMLGL